MKKFILKFFSIRTMVVLYGLVMASAATIIYTAVRVDSITYNQSLNYNNHLKYLTANAYFRQGTDLLTDAVRRYVVTLEPRYMEDYFREAREGRHRERALAMVSDLPIAPSLKATLTDAMDASKALMHTEYHAMHLISPKNRKKMIHDDLGGCPFTPEEQKMSFEKRHDRAEELLWDDKYIRSKITIYSYLSKGIGEARALAMERHQQLRTELLHMLALSAVSLIALVLSLCGFVFYRRYQHERMVEVQARKNARMNARLKEERDKSIKAEKAKSYFFSTVSHDIRTPLNSIIGFSEMLQLGIDDPEEEAKALDAIITSGQTLLELINDVLDLSKLESGKMELHPVPTDVATLVAKVATSFEAAASRSSVRLFTEVEKMPFLKLDPQRIRQILFNLVGNAVKFTAHGSITVRAAYEDRTFTLSVTDTGCGISKEDIGRLMSPYVQLKTHDTINGTGLGLAICKQLSTQMNGSLEIESTVGEGSTFTLRIPEVEAFTEQESAAYQREIAAPEAGPQLDDAAKDKTILIVDDQKLNLRILQTMLARLGIRKVLTAENGKEALETLQNGEAVDLVLTDMSMPVMDGAALVHEIRRSPRFDQMTVSVITADVEMQSEYRKIGFDGILIKPITLDKLRRFLVKCPTRRAPETRA